MKKKVLTAEPNISNYFSITSLLYLLSFYLVITLEILKLLDIDICGKHRFLYISQTLSNVLNLNTMCNVLDFQNTELWFV